MTTLVRLMKPDIEIFDIEDIQPYLHSILLPYFNEQLIELDDENLEFKDILHLQVKQTLLPINDLIEEEQRLLPSDTDITITAYEIFNNRELSQDVTTVILTCLKRSNWKAKLSSDIKSPHMRTFYST